MKRVSPETSERLADAAWLRRQYLESGRTARDIGVELECSQSTVLNALRSHDIPIGRYHQISPILDDPDQLREMLATMTRTDVAATIGCSFRTLTRHLRRHGIERATPPPLDPEHLRRRYVDDRLTLRELAAECGVHRETVRLTLARHGIERRDRRVRPSEEARRAD